MSGLVTNLIKLMVGRPRPDLINRCLPEEGAHDHPVYGLSNVTICTSKDYDILNDGFKSFPSGHSSREWHWVVRVTSSHSANLQSRLLAAASWHFTSRARCTSGTRMATA